MQRCLWNILLILSIALISGCMGVDEQDSSDLQGGDSAHHQGETIRLLLVGDPFAYALRNAQEELERRSQSRLEITIVSYDDVRTQTLLNATDMESDYDIISFDVVWTSEYGDKGVLLPLDSYIDRSSYIDIDDFLAVGLRASRYAGRTLGLPIQPHPELLFYRTDLLKAHGFPSPRNTDEVLALAAALNKPEEGYHGIAFNGQRGSAFGQQMAHFYGAFGQALVTPSGEPSLNTPQGIAAARYALALMQYAPPDILEMAWDQRLQRMAQGRVAMTYGWGARAFMVEEDPQSQVAGQVGYAPGPHAPDQAAVTPVGTWSLGIPSNINERSHIAWSFLAYLTAPAQLKLLADHGNGGMPRTSIMRDPDLVARYPVFATVDALNETGQLDDWMRPAVPQWADLCTILGTVYHDMMQGLLSPEEAAAKAQDQAEQLFSE